MDSAFRRLNPAISMIALFVALLALVAAAAGAGYAAATIGTAQLKNNAVTAAKIKKNAVTTKKIKKNAVTSKKVKNGTLTSDDLVAQEAQRVATLGNGGQGDCVWQGGGALLAGLGSPTFRKDRFGTVHLAGVALVSDGVGGDADCDGTVAGQSSDAVAFTLPAGYVPAKTILIPQGSTGGILIAGPLGVSSGTLVFPPGAVASLSPGVGISLDSIDFVPAGSPLAAPRQAASSAGKADVLKALGMR